MGNARKKYLEKLHQQRVNSNENKVYYQNGSEQHSPSPEYKIKERRTLAKPE